MIVRLQALIFVIIGMVAWNGVDSAIRVAKREAKIEMVFAMPLQALCAVSVQSLPRSVGI